MAKIWPVVWDHLLCAQQAQARVYNRGAWLRTFRPGDQVLVLVPTSECKFLAKWQGPYEVIEAVGTVNYRVRQPGRRKPTQIYHINLLKPWKGDTDPPAQGPPALSTRPGVPDVPLGEDLSPAQRQEMQELVMQSRDVFSDHHTGGGEAYAPAWGDRGVPQRLVQPDRLGPEAGRDPPVLQ